MAIQFNKDELNLLENNPQLIKEKEGFPVQQAAVKDMINSFNMSYSSVFINNNGQAEQINPNISNIVLKIKVSTIVDFLGIDNIYNPNHGVAFFYIIDKDKDGVEFYTYAITPATYDAEKGVQPKPNANNVIEYLVLTPDNIIQGKRISNSDFKNVYQKNYFDKIKVREYSLSRTFTTNYLETLTSKEHPTNCFYSDEQIYYFHEHNKGVATSTELFYLTVINGAMWCDYYNNSTNLNYYFKTQRPILLFKYNNEVLSSDNVLDFQRPYYYKALDVGRLCPPDC